MILPRGARVRSERGLGKPMNQLDQDETKYGNEDETRRQHERRGAQYLQFFFSSSKHPQLRGTH
jgi:hypothetical protein